MNSGQAYRLWLRWCRRYGPPIFATHASYGMEGGKTTASDRAAFRLLVKAGERPLAVLNHIIKTRCYPNGASRHCLQNAVGGGGYKRLRVLKLVANGGHFYISDAAVMDRVFDLYEAFVLIGGFADRLAILEVAHDDNCDEAREKAEMREWVRRGQFQHKEQERTTA